MNRLSVVIPVLDEAQTLPALLRALADQRGLRLEAIVADGGSSDGSLDIARRHGARIVTGARGRARQMNAGANAAEAPWLLFLHADCVPTTADQLARAMELIQALPDNRQAGHFALRFERSRHGHRFLYRYMEAKSASNRRYTINGDQGLLIARDWFRELGGFDESLAFLEDQRLAARIRAQGRWLRLPGALQASARRFEAEGLGARYLLMAVIMAMYSTGEIEFFERSPAIYRTQSHTGRLRTGPFLALALDSIGDRPITQRVAFWHRLGAVGLRQTWQIFLAGDILLAPLWRGRRPLLWLHDRVLAPVLQLPPLAWVAAAVIYLAVHGGLVPWCRWRERRQTETAA